MRPSSISWISSSAKGQWKQNEVRNSDYHDNILLFSKNKFQVIDGFGGCVNELGWNALLRTNDEQRIKVMDELFHQELGCRFTICRTPIGASDFALEWYSYNETEGDYEMRTFSIERDFKYLIPYIREALQRNPKLTIFASPWSPPTWMKFPKIYNGGSIIWQDEILQSYTLYFIRYIEEYQKVGIRINQLHFQNEPWISQPFASCLWSGEQMRDFIKDYLGPGFRNNGISTELWLGTINCGDYNKYAHIVLADPKARRFVSGVAYQWDGKFAVQQTKAAWPDIKIMQSENECGDGYNTWEYASYVFDLIWHYITNGTNSYVYWNLILQSGGTSTWLGKQNAMISIDPDSGLVTYNPDFYVMKHFSHFVNPGALRIGLEGNWSAHSLAFENSDGSRVLVLSNPFNDENSITLNYGAGSIKVDMEPLSFHTLLVK